jgi:hypothetical protein
VTIDPDKILACHCADWQKFSGAPYRTVASALAKNVKITGTPKHYVKIAQNGNRRDQSFCGTCGTKLYATNPDNSAVFGLRLGTIVKRAELTPKQHIRGISAMPWVTHIAHAPWFIESPSSAAFSPN